jgi:hypothetical protein
LIRIIKNYSKNKMQLKFYKPANLPISSATDLTKPSGFNSARIPSKNVNKSYTTDKSAVDTTIDVTF